MPCRNWMIAWITAGHYGRTMGNVVLSIAMLAGFALLFGAWRLHKRGGSRQQMWLMVAAALIMFANVAIWTVPNEQGESLVTANR